jgi:chromosome segregation protein
MWAGTGWTQIAEGDAVKSTADFHPLFFLQGQMSAMTGSRLDQFDLTRLIEGPIRESRRTLRENLHSLARIVRDGYQQKRKKIEHEGRLAQLQAQLKQKEGERQGFLDAAKKGLTEDQQKLFSEAEILRQGKVGAQRAEGGISALVSNLVNVGTDLEEVARASSEGINKLLSYSSGQFSDDSYLRKLEETLPRIIQGITRLREETQKDLSALSSLRPAFVAKLDALISRVNEFSETEKNRKEAIRKAGIAEKEVEELGKQIKSCEQEIQNIARSTKIEAADQALAEFQGVVNTYSKQFIERAEQISQNKEFRLIVKVIPGGLFQEFVEEMKKTCQGCGVRDKTWTELEQQLSAANNPASIITNLLSTIISSFSDPGKQQLPLAWAERGFSESIFKNILSKTSMEDWLQLSVVLAEDKVDVRYKKGTGKPPIPILSASPGERAVELLKLALYSTRGPLVIDQPEDDLDNHFLAEQLVDLVHKSKHTNQLIFASHNANLVVHGDAEVIHLMEAIEVTEGKVGCRCSESGTIDQESICLLVEKVMEGGRTAFEHRRRKYHETIDPDRKSASS